MTFASSGGIVWRPGQETIERAHLTRFMARHGIASFAELLERSASDIAWFSDAVLRYLEIEFRSPYSAVVDNLFLVMNLRRVLKEFLVQQISFSEGKVFLLFHPASPVKVEKLLELIHKQKSRFRLSPDGRLSFTPKNQDWEELMVEVSQLLRDIYEREPQRSEPLQPLPA